MPRGYTIDVNRPVTVEGQARSWFQPDPGTQKYTLATSYGLLTYSAGPPPSLAYTLQRQAGHRPGDGANETVDSIQGLTFVDSLGNIAGLDAGIRVEDDPPGASFGGIGRPEINSGHGYTGFWNAEYAADGESSDADRLYRIVRHGASE